MDFDYTPDEQSFRRKYAASSLKIFRRKRNVTRTSLAPGWKKYALKAG